MLPSSTVEAPDRTSRRGRSNERRARRRRWWPGALGLGQHGRPARRLGASRERLARRPRRGHDRPGAAPRRALACARTRPPRRPVPPRATGSPRARSARRPRTGPSRAGSALAVQWRTRAAPAMAVGTTGAPDSRASRPRPGRGTPSSPERERPPSAYITTTPPRRSTAWAVSNASASRWPRRMGKTPAWRVDPSERRPEELRLAHEGHPPAQERGHEEVVHEGEVVGRDDGRPVPGNLPVSMTRVR